MQAPAPARLIEGGLPTEATVAQVLVSKFADHLPLYRQAQIYARQGVALDRSTLADWVGRAAFLLRPVHERLLDRLKASPKLFADETTAPVLDPGRGRTKTGQLFAYARDDRPWGGSDPPGVAYVYAADRKAERPIAHLAGFTRHPAGRRLWRLQGAGPAERRCGSPSAGATCGAKFYELATPGPAPIASEALARIAELYRIEAEIRGRSAEERRQVRQERSRPLVEALEPWLRGKLAAASARRPSSPRRSATRCRAGRASACSSTTAASRSTTTSSSAPSGRLRSTARTPCSPAPTAAPSIGPSSLRSSRPASSTASSRSDYLADVITRIVDGHPQSRLDELLPWAYPATLDLKAVA